MEHIGLFMDPNTNKTEHVDCFTLNPRKMSPATSSGDVRFIHLEKPSTLTQYLQLMLVINIPSNIYGLNIYFHNRDQILVPNGNEAFGSAVKYAFALNLLSTTNHTQYRSCPIINLACFDKPTTFLSRMVFELRKTEEQLLDKPRERCLEGESYSNLTACVAKFLEDKLGCRLYMTILMRLLFECMNPITIVGQICCIATCP